MVSEVWERKEIQQREREGKRSTFCSLVLSYRKHLERRTTHEMEWRLLNLLNTFSLFYLPLCLSSSSSSSDSTSRQTNKLDRAHANVQNVKEKLQEIEDRGYSLHLELSLRYQRHQERILISVRLVTTAWGEESCALRSKRKYLLSLQCVFPVCVLSDHAEDATEKINCRSKE